MFKKRCIRAVVELRKIIDFSECLSRFETEQPEEEYEQPLIH